ncbi:hypothetical protein THIOKS12210026 [Thiocapsa sp. KS1]|nr:hypothetical protein THIOKS12210026 [Thiocapsa sp. KS1]
MKRGTPRRILNAVVLLSVDARLDGCRKLTGASMTYGYG